ncbi:type II toxin-antitoxin system PemK/MazF family toxin [Evansella sp. AB-P1]|uniref:type II toxin-antitoxin system PemK/MazF family toxin n=1 Tax=Evansella sp. AB-P1 TaxID=3037653 RepID=UPI00241E90F0|nr:type II toxin-antitoxin system PemK/MazF family toxin [Evansella sp. AB-P1]MDG5786264.1 type II toxin-antitoxin system PemK/MazF family toxin [Evansella sp. AB-P1]
MMHKQGDIVLLPVPFSDLTNRKQRPVLVISGDSYNKMTDDIIVVAVTSQLRNLDYSVVIESKDLKEGELKVTSAIRADKVYTLSKHIVRKKFGQVKTEVLEDVRTKLNELIK